MAAPQFDPSQPYQVEGGPPPFDPSQPYQAEGSQGQDFLQAGAAENRARLGQSAYNTVASIAQTVAHPIDTAQNIGAIGKGILQKVGVLSGNDAVPAADAAGKFFVDRYGGWDNISKTAHQDPVGFLMDLSAVLGGGGTLLKQAGGVAGKVGEVAQTTGALADPLAAVARPATAAAGYVGRKVLPEVLGVTTGAGPTAIQTAYQSGKAGGEAGKAFKEGLSGDAAVMAVNEAKGALAKLREDRGVAYRDAMAKSVRGDNQVLDFQKIDSAIAKVEDIKKFKGEDLSPSTKQIREDIKTQVEKWRNLPPGDFHTAEGLDALKQTVGDIWSSAQPGSPSSKISGEIYNSIKDTIVKQAPEYAKIMKGYEEASGILREIEQTLSLKKSATIDTQLRKLQSVLRNNVNTNYGRRAELLDYLRRNGAPNLLERLSGQALSSATPRGLSRAVAGGEGIGALTAMAAGHPVVAATLAGGLAASSPALVGAGAYGLGATSRVAGQAARPLSQSAFQFGRLGGQ
jgi:hypothetical protein